MKIGIPAEIKRNETRVALLPEAVAELAERGHRVILQEGAGAEAGASNDAYAQAGAQIVQDLNAVYAEATLIVKVKEPQSEERVLLRPHHILFSFLHLAPDPAQTQALLESQAACLAFETITDAHGGLPLLAPMSAIAGRLAAQEGMRALHKIHGGAGLLPGGIPGVAPAKLCVIGGGVVGRNAVDVALGLGARVCVLDKNISVLAKVSEQFGPALTTLYASKEARDCVIADSDVVIGAVLIAGETAPKLITQAHLKTMQPGRVIVDVAIDQGGCCASMRPTTHEEPTYVQEGIVHYGVTNIPAAVPRTASAALSHVVLPFVLAIANQGIERALRSDPHLRAGLNLYKGHITCAPVAKALGYVFVPPSDLL